MSVNVISTTPDGLFGVISAKDYMTLPNGTARSKTRDDEHEALKAAWEPGLTTPPGPKSLGGYVKVRLSDLPGQVRPVVILSPGNYTNPKAPKLIPSYPHTCHVCGGKMLILFSSVEHENGKCPGPQKTSSRHR